MKQWVKRLLRPLIPDSVMARYRLAQHSREVRTNVELFVDDPKVARRWLRVTPDTVRVRSTPRAVSTIEPTVERRRPIDLDPSQYLIDPIDVVVMGPVGVPRLVRGRRALPRVDPVAIAARPGVIEEVGGRPPGDDDLRGLHQRLVDAGRTIGIVPLLGEPAKGFRHDPIERPAVVIASAVPLHDIGGGSRTAQLALELVRRGFHVTYLSVFGAAESVDLGLRYIHPGLEQSSIGDFDVAAYVARVRQPALCLAALPIRPVVDVASVLREAGFRLVYELIDDWSDPALGGEWYAADVERRLIARADVLVGSAPDLVDRLEAISGTSALLVENGVNVAVFGSEPGPPPPDFPKETELVLGYHGSLYGDWFDWAALARVGEWRPDATVVVIGDIPTRVPTLPPNVHLLGLKRQIDLPGYVGRFDVGLLPFVESDTTHAVSPLKVYEYLAMGVPVAAPPLRSLDGLDGVYRSADLVEAVSQAMSAPRPDRGEALARHSWARRVQVLLESVGIADPEGGSAVEVISRPVVHHTERLV